MKLIIAGILNEPTWQKMHQRVFDRGGVSPTLFADAGGNDKTIKILEEDMKSKVVGKVLSDTGKEHEKREVYDTDYALGTIAATSYKAPPKIMCKLGDGLTLFESDAFGGVKVMDGVSPTLRAEKVSAAVAEPRIIDAYNHKDITENGVCGTITCNSRPGDIGAYAVVEKCIQAGTLEGGVYENMHEQSKGVYDPQGASPTMHTCGGGNLEPKIIIEGNYVPSGHDAGDVVNPIGCSKTVMENHGKVQTIAEPQAMRLCRTEECKEKRRETKDQGMSFKEGEYGEPKTDGILNTLTTVEKDNYIAEPVHIKSATKCGYEEAYPGDGVDLGYPNSENRRGKKRSGQAQTLTTSDIQGTLTPDYRIRKLTERECMRLMGVKDEDSDRVHKNQSKSSMYHLAGDSIVTSCLMALFGEMCEVDYHKKINELVEDLTHEN